MDSKWMEYVAKENGTQARGVGRGARGAEMRRAEDEQRPRREAG